MSENAYLGNPNLKKVNTTVEYSKEEILEVENLVNNEILKNTRSTTELMTIEEAEKKYDNILPLINYENRQCGFRGTKVIMKEGGVIKSDFCRHPIPSLEEKTKKGLIRLANKYNPIALRWGK